MPRIKGVLSYIRELCLVWKSHVTREEVQYDYVACGILDIGKEVT